MPSLPFPLPSLDELQQRAHVVVLPLRVAFRSITSRELMLFDGPQGWGEFGAFVEYGAVEAASWLACGLEMAWHGPPTPVRHTIPVNGTIPALHPVTQQEGIAALVEANRGVGTFKIKVASVGEGWGVDLARVALVHQLAPHARIRVDANGAWSVSEALHVVPLIVEAAGGVEVFDYVEQPCATITELADVRAQLPTDIRIAADESVRRAPDPLEVVRAGVVDRIVAKAAPLGGPRALLDLATHIPHHITISSALDSAVGMNAGVAAAAALPAVGDPSGPIPDCGLATGNLFREDIAEPHVHTLGSLPYRMAVPDPARLHGLRAPADKEAWWRQRLEDCYAVVAASTSPNSTNDIKSDQ